MTIQQFKHAKAKKDEKTNKKKDKEMKKRLKEESSDDDDDDDDEDIECSEDDSDEEDSECNSDDYTTLSEEEEEATSSSELEVSSGGKKSPKKHNTRNRSSNKSKNAKNAKKEEDEDDEEEDDDDDDECEKNLFKLLQKKAIEIAEKEERKMKEKQKKRMNEKKRKNASKKKNDKTPSKKRKSERQCEDDEEEDEDDDDDDYDDDDDEEEDEDDFGNGAEIILSIDGFGAINPDEVDYKAMIKEDKHERCNSDDEETFMKETFTPIGKKIVPPDSPQSQHTKTKTKKSDKKGDKKASASTSSSTPDESKEPSVEEQYAELVNVRKELSEQLEKTPKNKILQNAIQECKKSISELVKKERRKNTEQYYKLVHEDPKDKKNTNEMSFFKKKLSHKEQMRVMRDLKEINAITNTDKPYRLALLESDIPPLFKAIALQKLNVLKSMSPSDSEYHKVKNWVDGFMRVPYGIYKHLTVTLSDGKDKCNTYLKNAKETLDTCTYGLNDAKLQILQMVGQWISNPSAMGTAIAIKGPPGTGKTTLVKDGISKILGREFAFIALGGTGDASFLEGHSYTYEGSSWGKIVSILMDCKCMNPVIYFDELDKISDTPKGEEITSILTHLTDTTQNSLFHDKYFSEVSFDLSKCLFIFSYNDESKVNPILKDRMYRIQTKGYEAKEKIIIARKHLLPKIREQVNFSEKDVIIPDATLEHIISHPSLCKEEQGVRNLKRCLEIIHTKLNLFRLVNADEKLFDQDIKLNVEFPFTVEKKHVDALIKSDDPMNQSLLAMYV
jgi:ATP-dependent Lon protease